MPSRTWQDLPAEKRERVLQAALEEFGSNGFVAGSLNVVAREADVAKGSLFRYFDDKLDLFSHVVEVASSEVRDEFLTRVEDQADEHDDAFGLLRALLLEWVRYFRGAPQYRSLLFAATFEVDDEARIAAREVLDRQTMAVVDGMLDAAEAHGQLDTEGSREHLRALLLLLLPHLATAPSAQELDPVLGLASLKGEALEQAVYGFVDVLEAAYRRDDEDDVDGEPVAEGAVGAVPPAAEGAVGAVPPVDGHLGAVPQAGATDDDGGAADRRRRRAV